MIVFKSNFGYRKDEIKVKGIVLKDIETKDRTDIYSNPVKMITAVKLEINAVIVHTENWKSGDIYTDASGKQHECAGTDSNGKALWKEDI